MLHAFGAHGVTLVGDDEAGGLAVRRHHQLLAGFDVFVVEALVRDVEEVIAAGLVPVVADVDRVVECLLGLEWTADPPTRRLLTNFASRASVSSAVAFSCAMIFGKVLSTSSMEILAKLMSSAKWSIWSIVSNTDLNVQQIGMSKQCFSQKK